MELLQSLALAMGLGLLGFIEPCSVGSHLIFLKFLDRLPKRQRWLQTLIFTLVRSGFMALLGVVAATIGARFLGIQETLWVVLGSVYILLGLVYLAGGASWIIRRLNRLLPHVSPTAGGVGLGAAFGLNIPACAAPLLAVLLGDAAARAAMDSGAAHGALSLFIFGLALSSPLVLAVFTRTGRRMMNAITRFAGRMPRWTGGVLIVLGLWSIALAL
ncbi:urease accessory protein UreH domain-containing protein [Marinobacter fonticola]|uniref:urease accessory protein UreH domain-containing protein n=1 Tax=Marinobacter fonticola TaxID=2603215 RepID=UPI0011E75FAF|nr:cytochrome c biogenesis protein CcdA [Marinobacter fonticola]